MLKLHLLIFFLLFLSNSVFAASRTYVDEADDFSPSNPISGTTVTWKPGTPYSVSGLTFGTNAFTSIQSAVNKTNRSGVVTIAGGTYDEGSVIKTNKKLTLKGDGMGRTILTGGSNGDATLDPGEHSVLWVYGDGDELYPHVTLEELSIVDGIPPEYDGTTRHAGGLTIHLAKVTAKHCRFSGHSYSAIYNAGVDSDDPLARRYAPTTKIYDSVITINEGTGIFNETGYIGIIRTNLSKCTQGVKNNGDFNSFSSSIFDCDEDGVYSAPDDFYDSYCNIFYSTINGNKGAGINSFGGHVTLYSSTITRNGTGVRNLGSESFFLFNCTVFGNMKHVLGGSVMVFDTKSVIIANNIIAGTSDSEELIPQNDIPDIAIYYADTVQLEGVNFIGNPSGLDAFRPGTDLSFESTETTIDDLLDPILAQNGGSTSTLALMTGSLAVNGGDEDFDGYLRPFYSFFVVGSGASQFSSDAMFETDGSEQRGADFSRLFGGALDIGAIEANYPIKVTEKSYSRSEQAFKVVFSQKVTISDLSQVSLVNTETGATIHSTSALVGDTLTVTSPTAFDEVVNVSILIAGSAVNNDFGNSFGVSDRATLAFPFANVAAYVDQAEDFYPPNPVSGARVVWNRGMENEISDLTYGVNAFSSIQRAVDSIGIDGNIFIARGIYEEGQQIEINKSILLQGESTPTTVLSGGGFHRVIKTSGAENEISINNLTIIGGLAGGDGVEGSGGGIQNNDATLTIRNSTIADNHAPSEIGGSGGGVANLHGDLRVIRSTFLINTARYTGGAIMSSTTTSGASSLLTVANSTFSHNKTISPPSTGGWNFNGGGAIYTLTFFDAESATLEVNHSTFTENSSLNGGGGGIVNYGKIINFANSVVAGNTTNPSTSNPDVSSSTAIDDEINMIGLPSGWMLSEVLGPLADYGGPTLTRTLLAGSPAVDAGDDSLIPAGITTDQRGNGFPRMLGAAVDLGAVEFLPTPALISGNPIAGSRGVPLDGVITLTFDQTVQAGAGAITIHRSDNGANVPASVTISGKNVSVTPLADYPEGLRFFIEVETMALLNSAGTPFAGISDPTQLFFITCVTESYVDAAGDFAPVSPVEGDSVTWNGVTSSVPGLTFGINAFDSVQEAIDSVCVGGTVYVAAGTYDHGGFMQAPNPLKARL